jgi:hypothetical protein
VLAGWLAGQIHDGNEFTELLEREQLQPPIAVYWEALMDVAKTDTIRSLDAVMEGHMDTMDLAKWKELLFSKGNSDEAVLAAWFEKKITTLAQYENFDEVEIIRMLRRYDYGEGPLMVTEDLSWVETIKNTRNYPEIAATFEALSESYDGKIDASASGRFPLDWSKQDFAAASDWLVDNADRFSDHEVLISQLGTMYRHKAQKDPETAVQSALLIKDPHLQGLALSNSIIPQIEKKGTAVSGNWMGDLPQGFTKQRSMAGYVLGLSRHSKATILEAQVKFQFLKDEFDLPLIQQQVMESKLSANDKIQVVDLLNLY